MQLDDRRLVAGGIVVGMFFIVGLGVGATGYVGVSWLDAELVESATGQTQSFGQLFVGLAFFQSVLFAFLVGPAVASLAGLRSAAQLASDRDVALVAGLGSFVGFYLMAFLAVGVLSLAVEGGGPDQFGVELGTVVLPLLRAGIPTGVVGLLTGLLAYRLGS
jgi:hypothetical protein